jgi:hypothetical protein
VTGRRGHQGNEIRVLRHQRHIVNFSQNRSPLQLIGLQETSKICFCWQQVFTYIPSLDQPSFMPAMAKGLSTVCHKFVRASVLDALDFLQSVVFIPKFAPILASSSSPEISPQR